MNGPGRVTLHLRKDTHPTELRGSVGSTVDPRLHEPRPGDCPTAPTLSERRPLGSPAGLLPTCDETSHELANQGLDTQLQRPIYAARGCRHRRSDSSVRWSSGPVTDRGVGCASDPPPRVQASRGPGLAPPLSHLLRELRGNAGKEVDVPECLSVAVGASRGCAVASALARAARSCCHAPVSPTDPRPRPLGRHRELDQHHLQTAARRPARRRRAGRRAKYRGAARDVRRRRSHHPIRERNARDRVARRASPRPATRERAATRPARRAHQLGRARARARGAAAIAARDRAASRASGQGRGPACARGAR